MKKKSAQNKYDCLVLAAGRGENDPMAKEFHVPHKCLLPIAGKPMISRVLKSLDKSPLITGTFISIENKQVLGQVPELEKYLGKTGEYIIPSKERASTSVLAAAKKLTFPILVTTADHALLTPKMIDDFLCSAENMACDLAACLVHERDISNAYPEVKRTYLRFSDGGYSGGNLFALMNEESLKLVEFWQHIERERKKPWKLIAAFGLGPLFKWLTGRLSLEGAFGEASKIIKVNVKPVVMKDPEVSIDVDKKSDHELVEKIITKKKSA